MTADDIERIDEVALARWLCPLCMSKQPRGDNCDAATRPSTPSSLAEASFNVTKRKMPSKQDIPSSSIEMTSNDYVPRSELRQLIRDEMLDVVNTQIKNSLNEINEQRGSFGKFMDFISDKFDKFTEDFNRQAQELASLKKENTTLRSELDLLKNKVSQLDQLSRASCLEIQCVPEKKSENILNIVKTLGRTINYSITDQDIQYCSRVAKLNPNSPRPRAIITKFVSPRIRDCVLSAVADYNKKHSRDRLNTHNLGFTSEEKSPVFVIENLSPENKQLHAAARKRGKELNYRFVWVRAGRIYMRKSETSETVFIRNSDMLDNLKN